MDIVNIDQDNSNINNKYKIPVGICKQAVMKIESAMTDILEAREDPDISDEHRYSMEGLGEILGQCVAVIINIVNEEIGEEEFINEIIDMDEIDPYPEENNENLLDMEI